MTTQKELETGQREARSHRHTTAFSATERAGAGGATGEPSFLSPSVLLHPVMVSGQEMGVKLGTQSVSTLRPCPLYRCDVKCEQQVPLLNKDPKGSPEGRQRQVTQTRHSLKLFMNTSTPPHLTNRVTLTEGPGRARWT